MTHWTWHMTHGMWHVTPNIWHKTFFPVYFSFGIGYTISTSREIQWLPYAGCFLFKLCYKIYIILFSDRHFRCVCLRKKEEAENFNIYKYWPIAEDLRLCVTPLCQHYRFSYKARISYFQNNCFRLSQSASGECLEGISEAFNDVSTSCQGYFQLDPKLS